MGDRENIPERIPFRYYVHSDPDEYQTPAIFAGVGIELSAEDKYFYEEKFGRPFYELALDCEFLPNEGTVNILAIDGKKIEQ